MIGRGPNFGRGGRGVPLYFILTLHSMPNDLLSLQGGKKRDAPS